MVKKIGEKKVFETRRFTVFDSKLKIAGKIVNKPYVRQNDCSEILAITRSGSVVLVRSYRPELDGYAYELPAGTLKEKENPKKAALRELEEETGYKAKRVEYLFSSYPLLGYSDCKLHFFLATALHKSRQRLEDDESIDVREYSPKEVFRMLREGKIKDMCVLSAMYHYHYILDQGRKRVRYKDPV
jgi:ADP-ribose pyrophosphatase